MFSSAVEHSLDTGEAAGSSPATSTMADIMVGVLAIGAIIAYACFVIYVMLAQEQRDERRFKESIEQIERDAIALRDEIDSRNFIRRLPENYKNWMVMKVPDA